ncbi:hypothetical protein Efla_000506 [Eimeria flavescens]
MLVDLPVAAEGRQAPEALRNHDNRGAPIAHSGLRHGLSVPFRPPRYREPLAWLREGVEGARRWAQCRPYRDRPGGGVGALAVSCVTAVDSEVNENRKERLKGGKAKGQGGYEKRCGWDRVGPSQGKAGAELDRTVARATQFREARKELLRHYKTSTIIGRCGNSIGGRRVRGGEGHKKERMLGETDGDLVGSKEVDSKECLERDANQPPRWRLEKGRGDEEGIRTRANIDLAADAVNGGRGSLVRNAYEPQAGTAAQLEAGAEGGGGGIGRLQGW